MTVLVILTLVYAGVLVAALAIILISILVYLWRIGTVLARARVSLELVAERSRALGGAMPSLHASVNEHVRELEAAARQMTTVRDALARARDRTAIGGGVA